MELTKEMVDRAYQSVMAKTKHEKRFYALFKDNTPVECARILVEEECLAATLAERERWLCAIRWCKEQYDVRVSQQSLTPWQVLDRLCIAFTDERGS